MSILINDPQEGSVPFGISQPQHSRVDAVSRKESSSPRLSDLVLVSTESAGQNKLDGLLGSDPSTWKQSWMAGKLCQAIEVSGAQVCFGRGTHQAQFGDCVVARVSKNGNHSRLFTDRNIYSRIYRGDIVLGVLGTRYATDAFHAPFIDPDNLHLLTNAGLIGTVTDKHANSSSPTELEVLGYLMDDQGKIINFKETLFQPTAVPPGIYPIFVVGTGMNSGKTTTTARIGQCLSAEGFRVAILKLTGSGSQRDVHEYSGTGCVYTADFTDFGFPSTYLVQLDELHGLYGQMLHHASNYRPQVVLIEIADGIYQRETELLLQSPLIQGSSSGMILTALCAASAMAADSATRELGWDPMAVTGLITNSPLFVSEFAARCTTPVFDTGSQLRELCQRIIVEVHQRKQLTKMSA